MAVGLSGVVLDGLLRSLAKTDDSFLRLTFEPWMPDEQPPPEPTPVLGRFNNLDWDEL